MLAGVLATAAGAAASITFEAPVKVGVAGEPGYCYGLDADGLGTATRRPTLSAVCGTAHGDVYTASGGASWAPIVPGEAGKGTINELFHTADGTLRTVPQGHANAGNASWSGTSLGFSFERGAGAAVVRSASNRTTAWTGLPRPSLNGNIRLHQQGSFRVPRSACTTRVSAQHQTDGGGGCLLQAASVLWGGIDPTRTESLVLFASLDEGASFRYHATIAAATDYMSFPCVPAFPPQSVKQVRDRGTCWEGPGNENSLTRLCNSSLLAVLRMKYDTSYTYSLSLDGTGRSWTRLRTLPGIGCCRPRLMQLAAGPLLLTGGRCTPIGPAENHLWINHAGDLARWERVSLSARHNGLAPVGMPRYSAGVNCTAANGTRLARCSAADTLGYTSLLPTGNRSGLVVYNLNSKECGACAYSMQFSVGVVAPVVKHDDDDRVWAELRAGDGTGKCVDANGGGPVVDTYSCVSASSGNAANELWNITAAGEWLSQAMPGRCVVATRCAGQAAGMCLGDCGGASAGWVQRSSDNPPAVTLSPASAPHQCLTAAAGTLSLTPCSGMPAVPAQSFTWGPSTHRAGSSLLTHIC